MKDMHYFFYDWQNQSLDIADSASPNDNNWICPTIENVLVRISGDAKRVEAIDVEDENKVVVSWPEAYVVIINKNQN